MYVYLTIDDNEASKLPQPSKQSRSLQGANFDVDEDFRLPQPRKPSQTPHKAFFDVDEAFRYHSHSSNDQVSKDEATLAVPLIPFLTLRLQSYIKP